MNDLQVMFNNFNEWFRFYGSKYNNIKMNLKYITDDLICWNVFADGLNIFGNIYFQKNGMLSNLSVDEIDEIVAANR